MSQYRSCPVIENLLKSLSAKQRTFLGMTSKDAVQCILAFLAFIVKSPTLYSQFKTFVTSLMALIDLAISSVQLFIAQIAVSIDIIGAILAPWRALQAQIAGFLSMMPFGEFLSCPPIAFLASLPKKAMEGILSAIPQIDQIKAVKGYIKLLQYKLEKLEKFKKDLLDTLEQLKATKLLLQAMLNAIDQCFKDIRFPSV